MSYASFNSFADNYSTVEPLPEVAPAPKKTVVETPPVVKSEYDVNEFNKEFERMQAFQAAANYKAHMQAQMLAQQQAAIPPAPATVSSNEQGYFDKLFSKKKEFMKLLQWVLIVLLAIAIHNFIKYYMYQYLASNDFTFEREIVIRALYPIGIFFILWNLRIFGKS
jgi:hypothetical protein